MNSEMEQAFDRVREEVWHSDGILSLERIEARLAEVEADLAEVEAERDSLMADSWRAYAESGADTDGDLKWHCTPARAGVSLVDAVQSLRKDYDEALHGDAEAWERIAKKHGLPFLLDHLELDGLGNEVVELKRRVEVQMEIIERQGRDITEQVQRAVAAERDRDYFERRVGDYAKGAERDRARAEAAGQEREEARAAVQEQVSSASGSETPTVTDGLPSEQFWRITLWQAWSERAREVPMFVWRYEVTP